MTDPPELNLSPVAVAEFQDLVKANIDSYNVLTEAVDCTDNALIKDRLRRIALRRGENAEDLKRHLRLEGVEPENAGTLSGTLHQIWMNCRSAINAGDIHVLLVEAHKAEVTIQEAYESAIKHLSDSAVLSHVVEQYQIIGRDSMEIAGFRNTI